MSSYWTLKNKQQEKNKKKKRKKNTALYVGYEYLVNTNETNR